MTFDTHKKRWHTSDVDTHSRLREAIRRDGRTLAEIAAASGVDPSALSRLMRSERGITVDSLDLLAKALGLEVRLIRRGSDRKGR